MMPSVQPTLDALASIRADGAHVRLHPADVRGRFTHGRRVAAAGLIALYAALPWIKVRGYPAVFLDVVNRRFHLLGLTLAAQDLWLFFFLITGVGFALFFVTALLGRLWCGWACPQTVFLEQVYRRVERWFDGDAVARRSLGAAPWGAGRILRGAGKHAVFALASLAIVHLFLSYFVSLPGLYGMMRVAPSAHAGLFAFVMGSAIVLHLNFAWFREQLCLIVCPYGRLQSALLDDHSLVIGYDRRRGEPRGQVAAPGAGDCTDCHRCVAVCPTGIDIRQGLQMECIGCAACVDACDEIMARLGRPTGLVRYDSLAGLAGGRTHWLRPRTLVYAGLLALGAGVTAFSLSGVHAVEATAFRMPGAPFLVDHDVVRNQYLVRLINKRTQAQELRVTVRAVRGEGFEPVGLEDPVTVPPMGEVVRPLILLVPRDRYAGAFALVLTVTGPSGTAPVTRDLEFLGPDPKLLRERLDNPKESP
jgi:cytochrome c oxidase accessory protein FixG